MRNFGQIPAGKPYREVQEKRKFAQSETTPTIPRAVDDATAIQPRTTGSVNRESQFS
jgi:hypothetical protein